MFVAKAYIVPTLPCIASCQPATGQHPPEGLRCLDLSICVPPFVHEQQQHSSSRVVFAPQHRGQQTAARETHSLQNDAVVVLAPSPPESEQGRVLLNTRRPNTCQHCRNTISKACWRHHFGIRQQVRSIACFDSATCLACISVSRLYVYPLPELMARSPTGIPLCGASALRWRTAYLPRYVCLVSVFADCAYTTHRTVCQRARARGWFVWRL